MKSEAAAEAKAGGRNLSSEGAGSHPAPRTPKLSVPITDRDVEAVIQGARRVLDEIGVQCPHDEIRRRLASLPGAREAGERVCYGERAVDGILEDARKASERAAAEGGEEAEREPFTLGAPWCCLNLAASGRARAATEGEAADAVRLLEGLGAEVGVAPLAPAAGVPWRLRNLACLRTVLLHSRAGSSLTNHPAPEQIETAKAMGAAAGRTPRAFLMVLISPLRFEAKAIEYFLAHREEGGLRLSLSGGMPCTGSTSPMHLPGTMIQSLAEGIAASACAKALSGPPLGIHLRCDPFDMRYGNYVIGSPEYHLLDMVSRAVHRHIHGRPNRDGAFRTMAKQPDAQAMAERCHGVLFQALQGARHFGHAGQMSMDEVFSPEQAVFDWEILRNVERMVWGMDWQETLPAAPAVDEAVVLIRRGVAAGHYLDAEETLSGHRKFFYSSDLFRYCNARTWQREGSESVLLRATKRVAEIVAAQPECALPQSQAREVERIYAEAVKRFA